jgi:ribosomal protein L40E
MSGNEEEKMATQICDRCGTTVIFNNENKDLFFRPPSQGLHCRKCVEELEIELKTEIETQLQWNRRVSRRLGARGRW